MSRPVHHEVVDVTGMRRVFGRPPLPRYLSQLWDRRHFIRADARGRLVSGTRGTFLGSGWLALKPALDGAVYFLVFGVLLQLSRGIDNFVAFLVIGVFLFHYTTRCLVRGAQSMVAGRNLVRSFTFPRAALPVAVVVREAMNLVPVLAVMFLLVLLVPPLEPVTWRWLLFPVVLVLQTTFNLGLALLAARATAAVPDVANVLGFAARIWLYGSGVFFAVERFVSDPGLLRVLQANPLYQVLHISRDLLLYATTPDPASWAVLVAWAVGTLLVGLVVFWRGEETYGSL